MKRPRSTLARRNTRPSSWIFLLGLHLLVATLLSIRPASAYHIGDVVDTDIIVDGVQSDALRSQRPLFGLNTALTDGFVTENMRSFSMKFEDGLWTVPTIYMHTRNRQTLEKIHVQFIYSKSGVGAIHSVFSYVEYGQAGMVSAFTIEYEWIEEEAVQLNAGYAVMFLAVVLSSVYFIAASCGMLLETDGGGTAGANASSSSHHQNQPHQPPPAGVGAPKWD